jgi:hypothetical protein
MPTGMILHASDETDPSRRPAPAHVQRRSTTPGDAGHERPADDLRGMSALAREHAAVNLDQGVPEDPRDGIANLREAGRLVRGAVNPHPRYTLI